MQKYSNWPPLEASGLPTTRPVRSHNDFLLLRFREFFGDGDQREGSRGPSGTQSVLLACVAIGYLLCGKIKADRKQEPIGGETLDPGAAARFWSHPAGLVP